MREGACLPSFTQNGYSRTHRTRDAGEEVGTPLSQLASMYASAAIMEIGVEVSQTLTSRSSIRPSGISLGRYNTPGLYTEIFPHVCLLLP